MGNGLHSPFEGLSKLTNSSVGWITVRVLLLGLTPAALLAEVDVREIIRRAVEADERNWKVARNYGFSQRVDARRLDPDGRLKSKDVKSYEIILLEGSPYRLLAGRDDRPLPPGDEKKELEKLARSIADRRKETAAQRAHRLAEYESRPDWQREAWHELPEAFDFRLTGEETWGGNRPLYVIEATPRQGYQPRSRTAEVLVHLRGKLWVDKQDYHLVKAEVEVIDTISVGFFMVRLAKGSSAMFEETRVNNEVWLPRRVQLIASARLGLLKVVRIEQEMIYSKCREFQPSPLAMPRLKPPGVPLPDRSAPITPEVAEIAAAGAAGNMPVLPPRTLQLFGYRRTAAKGSLQPNATYAFHYRRSRRRAASFNGLSAEWPGTSEGLFRALCIGAAGRDIHESTVL